MKNFIPKPCHEKLDRNNFCQSCMHHIHDFSNTPPMQLLDELEHNKPYCGIFSTEQLKFSSHPIYNLLLFSSIGFFSMPLNAQIVDHPELRPEQNIEVIKKKFRLKLEKSEQSNETYRLIINGIMVYDSIKNNEWIEMEFEIEKDQMIHLSVHSNLKQEYYFAEYFEKNLPDTMIIQRKSFQRKIMVMGKIAYPQESLSNK